ncbi:MAG: diguanylate cyclase [Desulfarculaceae bacterium]|nr:diguanylate cyclase [Desulfarculaceae bacterium]MCF8071895.1 diguanylate cyclase [Desulfarculaceae bacterium]MCF8101445.1 diguanylate cyclase [Desulfarculaceae bacterium]MCF8114962.1 diguanylate cyclase [Desulfarculaceae bacterium]
MPQPLPEDYAAPESKGEARQPAGRLLVVDDSATARSELARLLGQQGHSVRTAANGMEALRLLDRHPEVELILCDLVMPVLDGLGMLRMLASRGELRRHPVLIISSVDDMERVVGCLSHGAMDFVRKPFYPEEMVLRVRNALALNRTLQNLTSLAHRDPLTGLYNHRVFVETLQRELSRSQRSGAPVGLLFADLDRFKLVNDQHGHLVGDEVLKEFARRAQHAARRSDLVARYGGEEFTILAPEADPAGLQLLAERLRQSMLEPCATSKGSVKVTVSIGGAVYDPSAEDEPDHNHLLSLADAALYRAKEAGRNQVVIQGLDEAE